MRFSLFFSLICLCNTLFAQGTYTIIADSVKMTSPDSAELVIKNHSQNIPGFLYNTGIGRTAFKHPLTKINDTFYLVGADTLKMRYPNAWTQGGNAFGTTGKIGVRDKYNIDMYGARGGMSRLDTLGSLLIGGLTANGGCKLDVGESSVLGKYVTVTDGSTPANDITIASVDSNRIAPSVGVCGVRFGKSVIGVSTASSGNIPIYSMLIGGGGGSGMTTLADNHNNPVYVVYASGQAVINGGYNGIAAGGTTAIASDSSAHTFNIEGARGTGAGASGDIVLSTGNTQTSGSTIHTMTNRWWLKGNSGYLSNNSSPNASVDIAGANGYSQLRMRTTYTPTSSTDTNGNVGDFSWDSNYLYVRTSTGWKRLAITTF